MMVLIFVCSFFFFKQKTAYEMRISDWSSDVCSSDLCNIRGFQLASTAQLVPVSYSGLVFAALLGLVVFDEWPRPATIAGAALIVAGAIWLARRAPLAPTAATQPVD